MRVVDRLARREQEWRELQLLLYRIEGKRARRIAPGEILRLGELYRSACADLMLSEAHDLPRETVSYLHALVGRAHNVVYPALGFRVRDWGEAIFGEVPRRLRTDPMLVVAALTFWGWFLLTGFLAGVQPGFAARVCGDRQIEQIEQMYSKPLDGSAGVRPDRNDSGMAGFYIMHNGGITLSCYAWGLAFGVGSLFTLATNAIFLGAVFGHVSTTPQAGNFFTFVTAHGPFELTAIVFSGAAGLRMGSGLIFTRGSGRLASLRREARNSLPIGGVAVILIILAAFIEGFVSASPLPYAAKATVAVVSTILLAYYVFFLGRRPTTARVARPADPAPSFS